MTVVFWLSSLLKNRREREKQKAKSMNSSRSFLLRLGDLVVEEAQQGYLSVVVRSSCLESKRKVASNWLFVGPSVHLPRSQERDVMWSKVSS